jgi:dihydrofolate reductase
MGGDRRHGARVLGASTAPAHAAALPRVRRAATGQKEVPVRKLFSFHVSTVDGYYEGPHGEFDWPVVDQEFNQFALQQLEEVDTLLFGRVTYQLMASYWPTPAAAQDDPNVAAKMNSLPKLVVSRTLKDATWANTRLLGSDVAAELTKHKQQPGKDMVIMGSSDLTVRLLGEGLVDELRIMVTPVVLGAGKSLFRTADSRIGLRLLRATPFDSGNVLLTYQPTGR